MKEDLLIFFKGEVTTEQITKIIPEDFCGDVVVDGNITDKWNTSCTIKLNGGTLWVTGSIHSYTEFKCEANVFCCNNMVARKKILISGNVYVGNDVETHSLNISDDICVEKRMFADIINIGGACEVGIMINPKNINVFGPLKMNEGFSIV